MSNNFMVGNGAIGSDVIQYVANNAGTQLVVKYTGYNYIAANGAINVNTASNIHVLAIYGTNYLV